ncbi:NUDIX domain-containing protein [Actinocorallia sp. API 0066]|uniref:NUDIX hydrolase n=1 Tax=Actinocorallia sp. API 0066 TaxID=2896846 RepID=UPI001E363DE7|nr:NUDIX domain-containing protein [Actinocorallia sp. API 0066]MCD0453809.1 NUDIX domain-containing protein [Actinocorallia sp. API 0066]
MTIKHQEIRATLTRYLAAHPNETEHLTPLLNALNSDTRDLTSRHTFNGGHITCGAVVIDPDQRLLLIEHNALSKWLLPGGHLEPEDNSLIQATLRELEEETGISWHSTISPPGHDATPLDIDIHTIPANPTKNEPEHWHADFRYTFHVNEPAVRLQHEEVSGFAWRNLSDAPTPKLAGKLAHLTNSTHP